VSNFSNLSATKSHLIAYAQSLGFERVGVTSAAPLEREEQFLKEWLAEGRAGEMDYLEREPQRRTRPEELLPGAKSVIALAMNYHVNGDKVVRWEGGKVENSSARSGSPSTLTPSHLTTLPPPEGRIARYASGRDYHKVISKRLESFVRYVEALSPGVECRTFVDTGPLLERGFAQRAGLGFIGKNTMLITKGLGSWVFLASVVTTLDLSADARDERSCGECRLCIDACPTQAITEPFKLDARRCIAYLTIESDKSIPPELRPQMGGWVFGCDICQDVCPHNARPSTIQEPSFRRKPEPSASDWTPTFVGVMANLESILSIETDEEFRRRFAGSAFMRAGREGLIRNACVAAANLGRKDLMVRLQELAETDSSPIVQKHAAWALEMLSIEREPRVLS